MPAGNRENAKPAAIAALVSGVTFETAALRCGVSESTIRRWHRDDPGFRAELDQARRELVDTAVRRLAQASTQAAETLEQLLGAESETVRLHAARFVLDFADRLSEAKDVARRLEAIEQALGLAPAELNANGGGS